MTDEPLEAAEKALAERIRAQQKVKGRLARGRRDLAKNKRPVTLLKKLVADLQAMPLVPVGPDLTQLVELLSVYREMFYFRQGRFTVTTRKSLKEYPVARFVVEIKTLLQSDENVAAARRFRLEPAVIENTKNPNKSVFFPNDLSQGFGE